MLLPVANLVYAPNPPRTLPRGFGTLASDQALATTTSPLGRSELRLVNDAQIQGAEPPWNKSSPRKRSVPRESKPSRPVMT